MREGESARRGPARAKVAAALVALAVGLAALGACSDGDEDGEDAAAAPAAADCDPARPAPEGGTQALAHDGEERSYDLDLPEGYDGTAAVPLVVNFHGWAASKEVHEANTAMGEEGAARGFAVVTPDALGNPRQWNMFGDPNQPDDFAFALALVADLTERLCVDPERVYASGHSNGSAFAAFLVCREPYPFAAVAMVSATVPAVCAEGVAPSVLAIHGTADPGVLYEGGTGASGQGVPAAPDVVAGYAEQYGCGDAEEDEPTPGIERRAFPDCTGGAEVVLDTVVGGTHSWPGGAAAAADQANSEAGRTFSATGAILDFFERHRRVAP